jgi:L-Ala-D/L-Glu epimerase
MSKSTKTGVAGFEIFAADLPFRRAFKHAAAERSTSESILLRCTTDTGIAGWGECLPRAYVTGESRDDTCVLLRDKILPRLVGMQFGGLEEVWTFLRHCDGKAPSGWVGPATPQMAAWSCVDLALLDTFGRAFRQPVRLTEADRPPNGLRYSAVVSADQGVDYLKSLAKVRLYGFRQVKLKVGDRDSLKAARLARRLLGARCEIRADANMAWTEAEALDALRSLAACGIRCIEQPIDAANYAGLTRLVRESGLEVIVDESMNDRESLAALIGQRACTGVSVRISKCGGLAASFARCQETLEAGLSVQVGCQVGESSLLSAAHLILVSSVRKVKYAEGCFGTRLLLEDPARPCLQFGYGGRPPGIPKGPGFGVEIDLSVLERSSVRVNI